MRINITVNGNTYAVTAKRMECVDLVGGNGAQAVGGIDWGGAERAAPVPQSEFVAKLTARGQNPAQVLAALREACEEALFNTYDDSMQEG